MDCIFCREDGGELLWKDDAVRVVLATNETDYPGFCRVIWQAHVAEFSDLSDAERTHLMRIVYAVERAVRRVMQPTKVNLASLGNQVPHLHWHVIPRFSNDAHFPQPIWAPRQRSVSDAMLRLRAAQATLLHSAVQEEIELFADGGANER
ncbi:HIT family protein [Burkholderia singularis]|uniref:Diadenosine tetraphosphate (Ap4A) hydrolase and other HIT family hydrolases n=1 Tax=Burkholderia singularis TaxID=1503053 RepID=A0A238GZB5_9BURK|nr:HIT family protein [Burkholderia singularis]SMF98325.1 Diadenosine tetraphosphate (Ap4A) hydrolase and other HIT family hydrolases [Burkholderia singularis]